MSKIQKIYNNDRVIQKEIREGEPKEISYMKNGRLHSIIYFIKNKYHREDGLAIIEYHDNGEIKKEEYWLNGEKYLDVLKYLIMVGCLNEGCTKDI